MSGNFGGNSIPTTLIEGSVLMAGVSDGTYSDWKCTSVLAGTDAIEFIYDGATLPMGPYQEVQMLINPSELVIGDGFWFLCYPCSCENPVVSPVVITTGDTNYQNYGPDNKPIIIGGGGLNS